MSCIFHSDIFLLQEELQLAWTVVGLYTIHMFLCVCGSDCAHTSVFLSFFFVSYSMYLGILGLQSYTSSGFIGRGPLKHIVAVLCDLLSVLQAFFSLLSRSIIQWEDVKRWIDRWMTYSDGRADGRGARRVQRLERSEETERHQGSCAVSSRCNAIRFECFCAMRFEWMNRL